MNDIILLISGIIGLFAVISFFIMANNVSYIKDYIKANYKKDWHDEYVKRKYLKRSDSDVLFAAQEYVWSEITKYKSSKKYDELKAGWSSRFSELGGQFPENPYKS